jgi:uncharacterized protein (TIGR03437 family)
VGTNLADAVHLIPAPGPGQSFPTTLAGVSVSVNGVAAPLVYVSSTQINFQIPWETAPALAVPVKVTWNGVDSNVEQMTISSTASPSFFLSEFVNGVARVTGSVAVGCPTPSSECSVQAGSTRVQNPTRRNHRSRRGNRRSLIDPNVVHQHVLRERDGSVRRSEK